MLWVRSVQGNVIRGVASIQQARQGVKAKPDQPTLRFADAGASSDQRSDRRRTVSYRPLALPHSQEKPVAVAQLAKYRAMRGAEDVLKKHFSDNLIVGERRLPRQQAVESAGQALS